jgi:uncharacterized protein (TIGR01244 family)
MSAMNIVKTVSALGSILLLTACSHLTDRPSSDVDLALIQNADILNLSMQDNHVFASGQPSQTQLKVIAEAGVQHVISLRAATELDWDEAQTVQSVGMQFHALPISGREDVTPTNADLLEQLLKKLSGQPVLVHCGSSNRVAALKTLTASESGMSTDAALEVGRGWGLTKMEPVMRAILELD